MTQYRNRSHAAWRGAMACVALCSCAFLEAAVAQEQGHVTIDARRCLEIETPDERLACFEKQVNEAQGRGSAAPAAAAVPPPAPQQVPPPTSQQAATPSSQQTPAPSSQQPVPTVEVTKLPG